VEPIQTFRPAEDFVEQSSENIWQAIGVAVRLALRNAALQATSIRGIGFDATCSLVALDEHDRPVSVSPTRHDEHNVVVWMDHRATAQAERINATKHAVLRYVGGQVSPEMQMPKLLWLSEKNAQCWQRARRFLDLPDYLTYRATGNDARSVCTTTCKWNYLAHEHRFDETFLRAVGLGQLADELYQRIGSSVSAVGQCVGQLTVPAARDLGLTPGTAVGAALIDAHAGGLGVLGFADENDSLTVEVLETRLALIGGTSSCHMAVSREPHFVPGVWGPYYSAMVPGLWLTEGGQSATGALIDHVIFSHARASELKTQSEREQTSVYALLNARLDRLAQGASFPAGLAETLHVYPDFHGNRSPRANPDLRGMICGLKLSDSLDALALLYLATVQAVAYGTKHILEVMNANGHRIQTLVATGGDMKNAVFVREHADITGCPIVMPSERDAVLLGSAMLGAVASGDSEGVLKAMQSMSSISHTVAPDSTARAYHEAKYQVFQRMHDDQLAYAKLMDSVSSP
jgi:FGGY-family pentulose kinase